MRRKLLGTITGLALLVSATAAAHEFDHPVPSTGGGAPTPEFMSGGTDAQWELIDTITTGNPHTDLDFFTSEGETYASVGTLAASAAGGGQNIIKLTANGQVTRESVSYVSGLPSASCVTDPTQATGLQHDVEATPKGPGILSNGTTSAVVGDAQLILDATDNPGRCHDQGSALGFAGAPQGGLEIADVTNLDNPEEIALTSHIGESHTVNVDPKRPHIAYSVTSDAVTLDPATGQRNNEKDETPPNPQRFNLDGFEVVDLSSCMNFPAGTSRDAKRAACRPEVYRYRYPTVEMALGHSVKSPDITDQVFGCHELEIYADDRLTCGSGGALIVLDVKDAFDDNGTPTDFSDDKPKGEPLDCSVRPSSTLAPPLKTGAMVTDCVKGGPAGLKDLTVPAWLADGAPSLEGVRYVGSVHHAGRASTVGAFETFPATEDVDFDHEAEYSASRNFLLATDERGGGVAPPGATCSTGADNPQGNGGVNFYRAGALSTTGPGTKEQAQAAYAKTSTGQRAIYRAPIRTGAEGTFCTAHVFQQIPGQNRIFMGWYKQGTQVVDFTENADGTVDYKEAAYFIPGGANTWVSHVFKVERTPDCSFAYYGATGDFGRAAIDIYKVTLPAPPTPPGATVPDCTPTTSSGGAAGTSSAGTPGAGTPGAGTPGAGTFANACASSLAFRSATARSRGRGLAFGFSRRGSGGVTVDVFRTSKGARVTGERRVKRFTNKTRNFSWNGRGRGVRDGYYFVRFTVRAANGRKETRRVALVRRNGRFRGRPLFSRRDTCDLLQTFKLERPVFGGRGRRSLGISFRVAQSARVAITVRRGRKTVKRFAAKSYAGGKTYRLRLGAKGLRKGDYKLTLVARRGTSRATSVLTARKL